MWKIEKLKAYLRPRFFILLLALLSLSCSSSKRDAAPIEPPAFDKEQVWQLTALRGRPVDRGNKVFTLLFNPESNVISGFMACNKYYGHYEIRPGDPATGLHPIRITLQGSGSMECPEADMNAESRYYTLLPKATHLAYTSTSLSLFQNGKEILHYELQ